MTAGLTGRSTLAAFLASVPMLAAPACASSSFPAAIRRVEAADTAGRFAREILAAGLPLPAGWCAYRADLRQARTAARFATHEEIAALLSLPPPPHVMQMRAVLGLGRGAP